MPIAPHATAVIQSLSTDGRGVVRVEGVVYFVPRGLPGDRVLLSLDSSTNPPSAQIVTLLETSPQRVSHPCPHAAICQGSPWGSLEYAEQLKHKHELVVRTLRKAVGDLDVLPTVPSPLTWNYRNRISLNVWRRDGVVETGFHTEALEEVGAPIHTCHLASHSITECSHKLSAALKSDNDPVHIPRRIQIHDTTAGAGQLLLFAQPISPEMVSEWSNRMAQIAPGGIWLAECSAAGIISYGKPILHSDDALPMRTDWLGHAVDVHPAAFCQANSLAANLVGERLRKFRDEHDYSHVYDLYGGYGALGLAASSPEQSVTVFELSPFSEITMQQLAIQTGAKSACYVSGDLLRTLSTYSNQVHERDLIILDPPRSGAHPQVLTLISHSKARHLIYLSCNPARLGRDLALLFNAGFKAVEIQPYDFFPQTPSTEVLAILRRF